MKLKKIIISILLILFVGSIYFVFSSEEGNIDDAKIVSGFYDCEENEKVVPGDAICYSEYYYKNDIASQIKENYTAVTEESIATVKQYMNHFEGKFLYDTDKGNKDFVSRLTTDDYYFIDTGCSSELSENHFRLYYYDSESFTIYYMWRCQ